MIIGLSTVLLTSDGLDPQVFFPEIKAAGIKNIELSCPSHIDRETISSIRKNGLNIVSAHSDFIDVDISNPETYRREKSIAIIKTRIRTLSEIGAGTIIIHPGDYYENLAEKEKRINNSIGSLVQLSGFAKNLNVRIAIENLPTGFIADDISTMRRILGETRKALDFSRDIGICLDTGHANITGNLADYLEYFSSDIITMHIHDNTGNMGSDLRYAADDRHMLPGAGTIDWDNFLEKVKSSYKGGFIFEFLPKSDKGIHDDLIALKSILLSWNLAG